MKLGMVSMTYLFIKKIGNEFFQRVPKLYLGKENLYAKKDYTKFLTKDMSQNLSYFKLPTDYIIYQADTSTKRIYPDV